MGSTLGHQVGRRVGPPLGRRKHHPKRPTFMQYI